MPLRGVTTVSAQPTVEEKLAARTRLVSMIATSLGGELDKPLAGPWAGEVAGQRQIGGWERTTTPLEAGFYSVGQHVGAAVGHVNALSGWLAAPHHFATGALLVRGALESLSIAAWLLDPSADDVLRSQRALAEIRYSTKQLKTLYRDQGVRFEGVPLGAIAADVEAALARIDRDGRRNAPSDGTLPERPAFIDLIERLVGRTVDEGRTGTERSNGPLYRHLSAMAHGTKWAMNHYTTAVGDGRLVSPEATAKFREMLLFYLGIGMIRVGVSAQVQLGWIDLRHLGGLEFLELGPCEVDYGE